MKQELLFIAEAGVNHNGSLERALELVDVAAEAGADAIKFQTFSADRLARKDTKLAEYQRTSDGDERSQWDLLKQLELSHDDFHEIRDRCAERELMFLSTGFDLTELAFLIDELAVPMVKIASGDLTFAPMLMQAGRSRLPILLSTGMADLSEIEVALTFIAVGMAHELGVLDRSQPITPAARQQAWQANEVREALVRDVTVLHCTTQYPAPLTSLNLRAMTTIRQELGVQVGYSDHSLGSLASITAASLGATVIEKHFTLDKSLDGPDHAASLDPAELRDLVRHLRSVETILGSPVKQMQPEEEANRSVVRRSIVALRDLRAGEVIDEAAIECRRPAGGRSAFEFWDVVGTVATQDYAAGDYVD